MQFHKFKTYLAVLPLPARHLAFPHQCNSNFSQKIWWRPLRTNQGWPLVSLSWKAQSPTHIYKVSHQALQNIQTSSSSSGRGLGVWALGTYKERKWRDMVILEMGRRQRQRKGLRENTEKLDICVTQSLRNWRPVFVKRVTPQCSRDPPAPEDRLQPQVWLTAQSSACPGVGSLQDSADCFALSFSSYIKHWQ